MTNGEQYNALSHYRKTGLFEYLTYLPRPISAYKIPKKHKTVCLNAALEQKILNGLTLNPLHKFQLG